MFAASVDEPWGSNAPLLSVALLTSNFRAVIFGNRSCHDHMSWNEGVKAVSVGFIDS